MARSSMLRLVEMRGRGSCVWTLCMCVIFQRDREGAQVSKLATGL